MQTKNALIGLALLAGVAAVAVVELRPGSSPAHSAAPAPAESVQAAPTESVLLAEPPAAAPDNPVADQVPPAEAEAWQADHALARQALAQVGVSPEADQYWTAAINDLSLTNDQRRELIEDLNDTGLPKKPTQADLPLIARRIQIIDQLSPTAIDPINAAAFQEARKDLMNFYNKLTQPSSP